MRTCSKSLRPCFRIRRTSDVSFAVRERLKESHRYDLDSNKRVVLPALKVIESKMIAIFKRKKEARRNEAQNSAARAMTRAARAAGTDEGDDDSVVDSDDEGNGETVPGR